MATEGRRRRQATRLSYVLAVHEEGIQQRELSQ